MKQNLLLALLALALTALTGCQKTETVDFEVTNHYFVKNVIDSIPQVVFDNEHDFTATFGMAAVMGEGGRPTDIDFAKEFVIAVVLPETDKPTELTARSLTSTDGRLQLTYEALRHESQSYTSRPMLMLKVDRRWLTQDVNVEEVVIR